MKGYASQQLPRQMIRIALLCFVSGKLTDPLPPFSPTSASAEEYGQKVGPQPVFGILHCLNWESPASGKPNRHGVLGQCMRPAARTNIRLESCMSWHCGVGRMPSVLCNYRLLPRLPSAPFLDPSLAAPRPRSVAFWPHARKAGNPQRLTAHVDSRLFQARDCFSGY